MVVNECHTKNSIKKSEHSFFINAKLLILLQIARSSVFDSNRDVYQQFYQIVLAEIQKYYLSYIEVTHGLVSNVYR